MSEAGTKTFWLSFIDPDRPVGEQFLGVCVVDVSAEAAALIALELRDTFPQAMDGAEWIAAASRLAWMHDCNPGGEIGVAEITDTPDAAIVPRNRLLSREELVALGVAGATQ